MIPQQQEVQTVPVPVALVDATVQILVQLPYSQVGSVANTWVSLIQQYKEQIPRAAQAVEQMEEDDGEISGDDPKKTRKKS